MVKCLNCGLEVKQHEGKRNKLYCNDACRKAYRRKAKMVEVPERNIPGPTPIADTITGQKPLPDTIQAIPGQCWCCGKDIGPGLVCCGPCAWSGKAKAKRAGCSPPALISRTTSQHEYNSVGAVMGMSGNDKYDYPASKPGDADHEGVAGQHAHEGRTTAQATAKPIEQKGNNAGRAV